MTAKLAEALNKAQAVMGGARKDKSNPFFKSSYADLSSVFDAVRQPFADNGLSVSQVMDLLPDGRTVLITKLMHLSGEELESKMLLPNLADPQKLGSAITYYRRYSLMAIAGIPAEDDDGNAAAKGASDAERLVNDEQIKQLKHAIDSVPGFGQYLDDIMQKNFKTSDLRCLPKTSFNMVMNQAKQMHARTQTLTATPGVETCA